MKRVGKFHTHSPEFFDDGESCYATIGYYNSGNQASGFIENFNSGERTITHGGLLMAPNPGSMQISRDGQTMLTNYRVGLGVIRLDEAASDAEAVRVVEALFRVVDDKLIARVKLSDTEQASDVRIMYLHEGHAPSNAALAWADNPFGSWGGLTRMRQHKQHADYFEATNTIKLNGKEILTNSQFLISVKSKDNRVTNYLVRPN